MNYTNTHREIVMKYGIRLEGWSHPKWANPSELGSKLAPLQQLLKDLRDDTCRFVKCTPQELQDLQAKHELDIAQGVIEAPRERKTRSDCGQKKRKQPTIEETGDQSGAVDADPPPAKKKRTTAKAAGKENNPTAKATGAPKEPRTRKGKGKAVLSPANVPPEHDE